MYEKILDAVLFLLLFLGVGKGVLKKHFGEGGTAVYTGLGLFFAFALLLWEERTGFYLLVELGPIAVLFAILIVIVWAYKMLKGHEFGFWWIPLLCWGYLAFYYTFFTPTVYFNESLARTVSYVALIIAVISLIYLAGKKKNSTTTR